MKKLPSLLILVIVFGCGSKELKTTGTWERLDPALDSIVSPDAKAEIIADGFDWSEGPLWVDQENMLLFSDVPKNIVYKWTEEKGSEIYLQPSGYTGEKPRGGEMGSNGLLLDPNGNLVLCQHGDRRLAMMNAPLNAPKPDFKTVGFGLDGKRFNSPNDVAYANGYFYLTDPPYGLLKHEADSSKEIPFQGVYRISPDGKVQVLVDSLTKPNGIAFFPGGKKFLVANSDPQKAKWYQYELGENADGSSSVVSGKVFYDATPLVPAQKGLADGLKIDSNGNVFASGPGGVFIFNADGKVLGKLSLENSCSNTSLSKDEKTLYVTNDMYVLRIKLR